MKLRTVALRIAGVSLGLASLGLTARLWARSEIVVGACHLGRISIWCLVIFSGGLSIWLVRLAGPRGTEGTAATTPKT